MNEFYQKNAISFEDLCFRSYALRELKQGKNHPIHAVDTETYKGYARLITADDGSYLLSDDIDKYLRFLTKSCFKTAHNFCFNLKFDAQAILKYLPGNFQHELWVKSKVKYGDYKIKYIPKKVLSITLHKNRYAFYDVAQFYLMSLEKAAKLYLGRKKNPSNIDAERLNVDDNYWQQMLPEIIKYCKIDSQLTADLGSYLQQMLQQALHINPQNYVSPASLSKQYFRKKCNIPSIQKISKKVLRAAFYSYKGGRFEVLEKGYLGKCTLLDIKSAYSYEISNLIDITKGDWISSRDLHERAYYGFYVVKLWVKWANLCPVPFKRRIGVYCYPSGHWMTWMTKAELLAYEPYIKYEIIKGYEFYPREIIYPFRKEIIRCFKEKEKYDKSDFRYELVKKIPNSLYGTFYEKHKTDDKWYTGKMFNPIYASIITANTRIKVFMKAIELDLPTAAFATDSIVAKGNIHCCGSSKLGDWEKQAYGDTIILKSGIYRIANKIKTRGMNRKIKVDTPYGKYEDIFDYIKDKPDLLQYPVNIKRPVSMGEALLKTKSLMIKDINQWKDFPYKMDINKDYKRSFNTSFSRGGQIFEYSVTSDPYIVQPTEKTFKDNGGRKIRSCSKTTGRQATLKKCYDPHKKAMINRLMKQTHMTYFQIKRLVDLSAENDNIDIETIIASAAGYSDLKTEMYEFAKRQVIVELERQIPRAKSYFDMNSRKLNDEISRYDYLSKQYYRKADK